MDICYLYFKKYLKCFNFYFFADSIIQHSINISSNSATDFDGVISPFSIIVFLFKKKRKKTKKNKKNKNKNHQQKKKIIITTQ